MEFNAYVISQDIRRTKMKINGNPKLFFFTLTNFINKENPKKRFEKCSTKFYFLPLIKNRQMRFYKYISLCFTEK